MHIFKRPEGLRDNQFYQGIYDYFAAEKRILFLYSVIGAYPMRSDLFSSWTCIDNLLALDTISSDPITLVVDSPGGELDDCFSLYDTIKMLRSPVYTVGRVCCSAAVPILAAGKKGHRFILPNGRVMLHLVSGGQEGDIKELRKQQKEMERMEERYINMLLSNGIAVDRKQLMKDIDREFWLSAEEAISYGIADQILDSDWQTKLWGTSK